MRTPLYLFCGGPGIYGQRRPKPLMRIDGGCSLLKYFLQHLQSSSSPPVSVTLLCDEGQEEAFFNELKSIESDLPVRVLACGPKASTLEKFECALRDQVDAQALLRFGYPDVFHMGTEVEPASVNLVEGLAYISAAPLSSRFPRLVVDVYTGNIKSISNHKATVPANPMFVFGGDLWGRVDVMRTLCEQFRAENLNPAPTLEHDFFFWLINHQKLRCVMLFGERLWVDSLRDVHRLLQTAQEPT